MRPSSQTNDLRPANDLPAAEPLSLMETLRRVARQDKWFVPLVVLMALACFLLGLLVGARLTSL